MAYGRRKDIDEEKARTGLFNDLHLRPDQDNSLAFLAKRRAASMTNAPAAAVTSEDVLKEYLAKRDAGFRYNPSADPTYQQYRESAMREGNLAMRDTIGKASAMTGGYGNSYAQTAGQQIYNQYAQKVADKIPELEQLAYQRHQNDLAALRDQYDLMYARERNAAADAAAAEQLAYDRAENERKWAYQKEQDDAGWAYKYAALDADKQNSAADLAYKYAALYEDARQADADRGYKYYAAGLKDTSGPSGDVITDDEYSGEVAHGASEYEKSGYSDDLLDEMFEGLKKQYGEKTAYEIIEDIKRKTATSRALNANKEARRQAVMESKRNSNRTMIQ